MSELTNALADAIRSGGNWPELPPDVDLDAAYELQRQVVREVAGSESTSSVGLKAGMTAAAGQKRFGLDGPLIGVLYAHGRLAPGAHIASSPGLGLECEIGIVIDPQGRPRSAGPVIEIPQLSFADPSTASGPLLVAANIGSKSFIVGQQRPLRDGYDDLEVSLTRDGVLVTSGTPAEALGGPLEALDWMLGEAKKRQLPLADGMLLITGAIGGLQPAVPGDYVADFGSLGQLDFVVTG